MSDEDIQVVKSLPVAFTSVSHVSPGITKMLERRKEAHESLIQEMEIKIRKINEKTDDNIKNKSETMKKKLYDVKDDVQQYFIDIKFKLQNLDLEDSYYTKIKSNLTKYSQKELEAANEFCNSLRDSEESRLQECKDLLKETKTKATEIAHVLPFMLDEFFEIKILEMNKVTLSNYQHYAEIEKDLKLQVKNDFKLWSEELIEIKETIQERLKSLVKKVTVTAVFSDEYMKGESKSADLAHEIKRFNSLKSDFLFELFGEDSYSVSPNEVEKWLKDIQKWLGALDQSAKNIVQLYKSTITVLFHRYLGELDEIKKNIGTGVVHTDQVDQYQCEMYTPTADELNIQYMDELQCLQNYWGDAIQEMTDNINITYSFLKGATCLWDRHFIRSKELQIVILRDLENTIKKNATSSDCHEASLNIMLEELRQGSNIKELEKTLDNVKKLLNKMEQAYIHDANNEINVVLKYKTMMETGIEVLMTELKRFLTIHPPDYEKDPKKQRRRASQMSQKEPDSVLPIQILYCVFQVGAVKNWMFGLWEAIDQYIIACKQEIMIQVENWIRIQSEKIHERLRMKLMFHEPRFEHIKCANYEKRLRELLLHTKLLENHKKAAEDRKEELKEYRTVYEELCEDLCNKYIEESNNLLAAIPQTNSYYQARCYSITMRETLVPIENKIKSVTDEYIDDCTHFFEELKLSNLQFLSNAILFAEGGNFNMDEITDLYKELKKLEDIASKDIHNFLKEINTRFWKYTSKIQSAETNVTVVLTEVVNEHEHNEKIIKIINKLQMELREHVVPLKKLFNNIEKTLQRLINDAKKNLGKKEYLDEFVPQYQNLLKEVVEVYEYLYHPEPVDIYSLSNDKLTALLNSSKKIDYVDHLFNKPPNPANNDFLTKLVEYLHKYFLEISNIAQEFYNAGTNIRRLLDAKKLQPTFEDCMDEVLRKFKPYLIQCEICWLENTVNFLSILNSVKIFKEEFLTSFESCFYGECMVNFDSTIRNVMNQLKQDEDGFNNKLTDIYKRLKVLFGHPKNNEMLLQLKKDYNEIHEDNQAKFKDILNPRKEMLSVVFKETKIQLEKLRNTLPILSEDHQIYELIEKLMLQLTTKKTLLSTVVLQIDDSDNITMSKSIVEHIQNYFHISTQLGGSNESPHSQVKIPSLATISTEKSYSSADDFLNVLENTLNETIVRMEEFVQQKMIKPLEDFKNIWDSDIQYILSLYRVKYDEEFL